MPSPVPRPKITSITVAFNPDAARLAEQVRALESQVDDIVIVDNGSREALGQLPSFQELPARIVTSPCNAGLARGFNMGIDAARARGAEFVLLLDDDSVPVAGMVDQLVEAYRL